MGDRVLGTSGTGARRMKGHPEARRSTPTYTVRKSASTNDPASDMKKRDGRSHLPAPKAPSCSHPTKMLLAASLMSIRNQVVPSKLLLLHGKRRYTRCTTQRISGLRLSKT